jgi:hypothetical protein
MQWLKLWVDETLTGTTFSELNAEERGVWYSLLVLSARQRPLGVICVAGGVPMTMEQIAAMIKVVPAVLCRCLEKLVAVDKLKREPDGTLRVVNWNRYQSEYERQRPYRKARAEKIREIQSPAHAAQEIKKAMKRDVPARRPAPRFKPPTVDEVRAYCEERKNRVDPQGFVDFYTSKGWLVGKTPMKDWRAAVRTWERKDGRQDGDEPKYGSKF